MVVLGIETSCDDTSVALVNSSRQVLALETANQDKVHKPFGGVVPEIAGRNHSQFLLPIIDSVLTKSKMELKDISGIAVTHKPGLVGSLLVGLVTAKTLALVNNIKLIGVHHIEGHLVAPFLMDDEYKGPEFFKEPFIALIVSGGHTHLYLVKEFGKYQLLGQTIDDAAGEAFDKFAKMLSLGYPGGPLVDKLAQSGDDKKYLFPKPMSKSNDFKMSFSGLKTSASRLISQLKPEDIESNKNHLCASFQKTVVDSLIEKVKTALVQEKIKKLVISGGVSANSLLRSRAQQLCNELNCELAIPPLRYCTDNAAMIALLGMMKLQQGLTSGQDLSPIPYADLQNI